MSADNSLTISAEAILKSRSGQSLTRGKIAITAENVENFTPAAETIDVARKRLEELGFNVSQSGVTLTVLGNQAQFEKVFRVKLTVEKDKMTRGLTVRPAGELVIPDSLRDVVEEVLFPKRPEYF